MAWDIHQFLIVNRGFFILIARDNNKAIVEETTFGSNGAGQLQTSPQSAVYGQGNRADGGKKTPAVPGGNGSSGSLSNRVSNLIMAQKLPQLPQGMT